MTHWFAAHSKMVAALVVALPGVLLTNSLVSGSAAHWVYVIEALLTASGVYVAPANRP